MPLLGVGVALARPIPPTALDAYRSLHDLRWPVQDLEASLQDACDRGYRPACADVERVHEGALDRRLLASAALDRCSKRDPLSCVVADLVVAGGSRVFRANSSAPLCEAGDGWVCGAIAAALASGAHGVRDPDRARGFAEDGCERGAPRACRELGLLDLWDTDATTDGFAHLSAACTAGDAVACSSLAVSATLRGESADGHRERACTLGFSPACNPDRLAPLPEASVDLVEPCGQGDGGACAALGMGRLAGTVRPGSLGAARADLGAACALGAPQGCAALGALEVQLGRADTGEPLRRLGCAAGVVEACGLRAPGTCADGDLGACRDLLAGATPDTAPPGVPVAAWGRAVALLCDADDARACRLEAMGQMTGQVVPVGHHDGLRWLVSACAGGDPDACAEEERDEARSWSPRWMMRMPAVPRILPVKSAEPSPALAAALSKAESCAGRALDEMGQSHGVVAAFGMTSAGQVFRDTSGAGGDVAACMRTHVAPAMEADGSLEFVLGFGARAERNPPHSARGIADGTCVERRNPLVLDGDIRVKGEAALDEAVRRHFRMPAVLECAQASMLAGTWPDGLGVFGFTWHEDGTRGDVEIVLDEYGAEGVAACVAASALPFVGRHGRRGDLRVELAFEFDATRSGVYELMGVPVPMEQAVSIIAD